VKKGRNSAKNTAIEEAIEELLYAAYLFDDKPYKLYWRIIDLANVYLEKDDPILEEIIRLMNSAAD